MTEKLDFEELGETTVNNEPERAVDLPLDDEETVTESVSETDKNSFEFNVAFFVSTIIEVIAGIWRVAWGESEGAELTETEKNGFISLFERGCDHFGFSKHVDGSKGFFLELIGRLLSAITPRATKQETRKHFMNFVFNKEVAGDVQHVRNVGGDGGIPPAQEV